MFRPIVIRHTGGLEVPQSNAYVLHAVSRHTGGLEELDVVHALDSYVSRT